MSDNELPTTPSDAPELLRISHQGKLTIAGFEMGCYVLDTPTQERVISRQGLLMALGRNAKPTKVKEQVDEVPNFLRASNLKPFISSSLVESTRPVFFASVGSKRPIIGYNVDVIKDICYVFIDAQKAGALKPSQAHIAERCDLLVRGFAAVGLRALVDEATGFQEVRPRDDLQRFLDQFLLKEYARWVKRFPDEFFENIFKMKGWTWNDITSKKPQVVGRYINDIVYDRLAPLILAELREKNPANEKGNRKAKHHQWLTPDVGHPKLQEHLTAVMALQRVAGNSWRRFMDMLDAAFPRYGHTLTLAFGPQGERQLPPANSFDAGLKGLLSIPPPPKPAKRTKKTKPDEEAKADEQE